MDTYRASSSSYSSIEMNQPKHYFGQQKRLSVTSNLDDSTTSTKNQSSSGFPNDFCNSHFQVATEQSKLPIKSTELRRARAFTALDFNNDYHCTKQPENMNYSNPHLLSGPPSTPNYISTKTTTTNYYTPSSSTGTNGLDSNKTQHTAYQPMNYNYPPLYTPLSDRFSSNNFAQSVCSDLRQSQSEQQRLPFQKGFHYTNQYSQPQLSSSQSIMSNSYMLAQSAYIGNHNISPSKSDGTRLNQSVASSRNRALSISTVLEPSTGRTLINLPFLTYSRNHDDTLEYDNEDDE